LGKASRRNAPWGLLLFAAFAGSAYAALAGSETASPGREPVLKQIRLPHRYYFREMYLPQVTSGPGSFAWSPDGGEMAVSMQGSLWRVSIEDGVARQVTDGPGYDHQPDWSPDGRFLAYASYRDDAVELWVRDLRSGESWQLTTTGAVNVEPRFSPDGRRIAFVSTQFEGRFHVFVMDVNEGRAGLSTRLTEDKDNGPGRYYYSRYDHYLSPTWSPDGREIVLVSNRGRLWGTGGLWRMEASPGAAMREIQQEETSWKAAPDWSRDGRRLVWSSYLGGDRNRLWLIPAGGGDSFPLTYDAADSTRPRFSPDGQRIAYISNEAGNTALWTIDVPGGRRRPVEIRRRERLGDRGTLTIRVTDAVSKEALPARLSITGPDGRAYAPEDFLRHADDAFDRSERRFEYSYFHTAGEATLSVPAGPITVEAARGPEYRIERLTLQVGAGATTRADIALTRIADLAAEGWWSGDMHVHMNYGGHYKVTTRGLVGQMRAEDLHVVENLLVNKEQRIPDLGLFTGALDPASTSDALVFHSQEFHTSAWGHTGLLGLREHVLLPAYAAYANTAAASLVPTNATVADLARAQGALFGYVHPFDAVPDFDKPGDANPNALAGMQPGDPAALPVDVALGKVDYYEAVGFSDPLPTNAVWHRLLNCGFRIPAAAGTDAMANYASLRGPVGLNRVYARLDGPLDHDRFLAAIKAGRTMATNGPLVSLGLRPRGQKEFVEAGGEIALPAGRQRLEARVRLRSIVAVDRVEVITNGRVVANVPLGGDGKSADAQVEIPLERSSWLLVRAYADGSRAPVMDVRPYGTTSPIYVTLGGAPVRSQHDARYFGRWIDVVAKYAETHPGYNTDAERSSVAKMLADARAAFSARDR